MLTMGPSATELIDKDQACGGEELAGGFVRLSQLSVCRLP